jgi:hypothetical protein
LWSTVVCCEFVYSDCDNVYCTLPECYVKVQITCILRIGECPSNSPFLKNNGAEGIFFVTRLIINK